MLLTRIVDDSCELVAPLAWTQEVARFDDLAREVHCLIGMPVDAIVMSRALQIVRRAARVDDPFLLSTPNVNFLLQSLRDVDFRRSVQLSELCAVDGTPLLWLARLLGIPVRERVAGSDMMDILASAHSRQPIKVFFFGGAPGVAEAAARLLNARNGALVCVGSLSPGFGSLDELSTEAVLTQINASGAQFLVVALGAAKGQAWLLRNHRELKIPVRAHLGAVLNFQAGTVRRAPTWMRRLGLEWAWRIKEEPHLWSRYLRDGLSLAKALFTHILPVAVLLRSFSSGGSFTIEARRNAHFDLILSGPAVAAHASSAIPQIRQSIVDARDRLLLDVSQVTAMDLRFLGLLQMTLKQLQRQGRDLRLVGASRRLALLFRLNGLQHLLVDMERV